LPKALTGDILPAVGNTVAEEKVGNREAELAACKVGLLATGPFAARFLQHARRRL
jgi:hypothetical protein